MKEGTASRTARSVAAHRLEYERVPAPYGDPAADEALTSDVADGFTSAPGGMHEYIRARTAFFDRVVVTALDRGVKQVVNGGAGYDGRALRYAKPGVRWFEVDHPATQADKRERLSRLGLATPRLSFIPADFTADPVAEPLLAAGFDPGRLTLFLFEGVAVYLDQPVIERVLREFREITPVGSPLAVSVSVASAASQTRDRFLERVAEIGEPARTVLTFDQADGLLAAVGWKVRQPSDRQRSAGLLLAHATAATDQSERQRAMQAPPASAPGVGDTQIMVCRLAGDGTANTKDELGVVTGEGHTDRRRGSAVRLVNAAYTSQAVPFTDVLGVREGDRLHCTGCGAVWQADHAAAINILHRDGDPGITLHTPHTRVKQLLQERADHHRSRLPDQDSSTGGMCRCGERNIQPMLNNEQRRKQVLSMRLGKEQAVGYIEDTEDDALRVEELPVAQSDGMPVTPAAEPSLTVN